MNVDYLAISELLRLHDNDGLNLFGASDDKYEPEVERIVPSLEKLSREEALGNHPKAAIDYHFKTGHRETA